MDIFDKALTESKLLVKDGVYYEVRLQDGHACIFPVGGGIVTRVCNLKVREGFQIADSGIPKTYKKGFFTIDNDPNLTFEGYAIPGDLWNGFEKPVFEIQVACNIAEAVNKELGDYYHCVRDNENKCFTLKELENDYTHEMNDFEIEVDGKKLVVVSFMTSNWCWEEV
ncbi:MULTISPECIES: hypothetical protein [unclassified Vibrio]|uniref:hypothetical protein n=1 Tax=unclassified Vibrio TaxID=2614977 RepID=UPI002964D331|nr:MULTISPECIES: hypothetical protein [unclassified Vibrio]MDW1583962.1 hypothetical protein [Vibrio sp. Vb2897]MDW1642182.1 hypothetical protein [Vibrio sp. Vb2896]